MGEEMNDYNNFINKAVDRLSDIVNDDFHGYRSSVYNIILSAIKEATQPTAQPTETCKWKRGMTIGDSIINPHDDRLFSVLGMAHCNTCGKRIEVVE